MDRAGERLRERRLADAGEVLDDQMPLREEAEERELERLLGGVDDAPEIREDTRRELHGTRRFESLFRP